MTYGRSTHVTSPFVGMGGTHCQSKNGSRLEVPAFHWRYQDLLRCREERPRLAPSLFVKLESGSKVQYFPEEVCVTVIDRYDGAEPPLTTSDAQYWNDNETEEGFWKRRNCPIFIHHPHLHPSSNECTTSTHSVRISYV